MYTTRCIRHEHGIWKAKADTRIAQGINDGNIISTRYLYDINTKRYKQLSFSSLFLSFIIRLAP